MHSLLSGMKTTDRVLSVSLAAMIALGAFVLPMNFFGMQTASAAIVTIDTSADDHGKKFFGDSLLQVIITDDSKTDSGVQETITPDIEVRDNTGSLVTTLTPDVQETGLDTSAFEWFVSKTGSTIEPQDPENSGGLPADPNFLDRSQPLADGWSLKVIYKGVSTTITFTDQPSSVGLDRTTSYGSDNLLFLTITDQDANADPTNRDVVITDDAASFPLIAGDTAHNDGIVCTETGDNTAAFECTYQIGTGADLDPGADNQASVAFTVKDQSTYMTDSNADHAITAADTVAFTAQTSTDDITATIEDIDGTVGPISQVTMSSELPMTLTDSDRNLSSKDKDTLASSAGDDAAGLCVAPCNVFANIVNDGTRSIDDLASFGVSGLVAYIDSDLGDVEAVPLTETADTSGIFTPDLANDQLKVSFLADGATPTPNNGILEFTQAQMGDDIVVAYVDPRGADGPDTLAYSATLSLTRTPGTLTVDATAGINSDFKLTITDPDLNDNSKIKESYTIDFTGDGGVDKEFDIQRASSPISDVATLELQIEGNDANFAAAGPARSYTLTETGPDTGVFIASLDMGEIITSTDVTVQDGDKFKFTYNDRMGDTDKSSTSTLTIGRASTSVDLSRDELPIPPIPVLDGGLTADALGSDEVVLTLSITDPDKNVNSGREDTLPIVLGTGLSQMQVKVSGSGFSETSTDETNPIGDTGVALEDIITPTGSVHLDGLVLKETGANTGVFEEDLVFSRDGGADFSLDQWQDLRLTFVYKDAQSDTSSAGVTFRGHDSSVTADPSTISPSGTLKIILQDEDLNLDSGTIEEFDCTFDDSKMIGVAAEDNNIANAGDCGTFTETGEDTGVFEDTIAMGTDMNVIDLAAGDQASNIHITYNEEVDSSGAEPDQTEIDVPIVTATGAIQTAPDLVGPGTKITVHVSDSDLNETPDASDTVAADEGTLKFRSDRTEVGSATSEMKETGPNSGVFEFKLQLVTDAQACKDDNLAGSEFDAQDLGGQDASIGTCPGDLISIRYDDNQDANGHHTTVSKVVEVKSWDPEFKADKDSYTVGDRATITIADPDANTDADVADTLRDLRVYSDSDAVGQTVSAIETGKDTGVFKFSVGLTSGSQSGGIQVKNGDSVTVQYTDDFPANFVDTTEDKKFKFTFEVAGLKGVDTTQVSAPELQDVTGKKLTEVSAGQQVVLSTTVINKNDAPQPFVALVEVRDSSGVTVYLAWQTGTLSANGQTNVGLSWTPENSGSYEVRTFVISNLSTPTVLSKVSTSNVTVS